MSTSEWLLNPEKGVVKTVRLAQVRMGNIVEDVLENGGVAMIEAGTGTGKSFAYLVPAILSEKRVLISTAKKALQQQLRDKDLPFLLSTLKSSKSFASLKGKSNYACKLRLEELQEDAAAMSTRRAVMAFSEWLKSSEFGDLDDYDNTEFLHLMRVNECIGSKCHHAESCGYRLAKSQANEAKIVVVNHALLAFDLFLGGGKIIGAYDALIIDEAHQVSKYFREAQTCRIHVKQADMLRKLLDKTDFNVPAELEGHLVGFINTLPDRGIIRDDYKAVELSLALYRDLDLLKRQFIAAGLWSVEENTEESLRDARELGRLRAAATLAQRMLRACEVTIDKLDLVLDTDGNEVIRPQDFVCYAETKNSRGEAHKEFVVSPIEIGPFVAPVLKRIPSLVFTSATLTTGGTFDYACREVGIKKDEVKILESVPLAFNYRMNSCVYISAKVPEYKYDTRREYWDAATTEMHELLEASKGGAFILCSSYEDMNSFYERLAMIPGRGYEVSAQANNVNVLLEWFKATRNAVILGVKSIWEGVDIPGLGLRLVIIPRLPFPSPQDPVLSSRKEKYITRSIKAGTERRKAELNAWNFFDLQEAIMDFKQGAGRLIRRETDKGVVAVLDRRVYASTKAYSGIIRASIPHPPTHDLVGTKKFLDVLARNF